MIRHKSQFTELVKDSLIIQNGKLAGAVTRVLVNEPTSLLDECIPDGEKGEIMEEAVQVLNKRLADFRIRLLSF